MTNRQLALLATAALAWTGCGAVESFTDAALPADASVDAPDAVTRGAVVINVHSEPGQDKIPTGRPGPGTKVAFVDTDGTTTVRAVGDDGRATADVFPGASVTVAWPHDGGGSMVTLLGVEPGDVLDVGEPARVPSTQVASADISFARHPDATSYELRTPCGSFPVRDPASTSVPIQYSTDCAASSYDYALIVNTGAPTATPTYYARLDDKPLGAATVPATWRKLQPMVASFSGVPDVVTTVAVSRQVRSSGHLMDSQSASRTRSGSTVVVSVPDAIVAGDDTLVSANLSTATAQQQMIIEALPPSTTYGLQLDRELLPWLSEPTLTAATRTIAYKQTAGAAPAAFLVELRFARIVNDVSQSYGWRIIGPGSTGAVILPTPPADLADFDLKPTDTITLSTVAVVAHRDSGYPGLRRVLGGTLAAILQPTAPARINVSVASPGNATTPR